jgi:PAS domain S-box-containing protein
VTSQAELERFFAQVQAQCARTRAARDAASEGGPDPELLDELELVTEMLLNAEEELRVQSEELTAARVELDRVWARNEELFGSAPTAYAVTDVHGTVVDANRTAWQLFGFASPPDMRHSMMSMFAAHDRQRVRSLLGQAVAAGERPSSKQLVLAAGTGRAVAVSVEAHTDPRAGTTVLRWQFAPSSRADDPALQRSIVAAAPEDTDPESAAGPSAVTDGELSRLLSLARSDLAKELSGDDGPDAMLADVVELACRWVPGAEHASVCQLPGDGPLLTLAASDPEASACDMIQRDTEQGPIFDATTQHTTLHVDDLAEETRWPLFTTQARDLEVRSILACELPLTRGGAAALNLYSTRPGAFTAIAELIAPVFAARASIALAHADEVHHLQRAIETRQTIGQALGILVERHHLTPDQAFELLVDASKTSHIKLRDIAARINETGEDPRDLG